MYRYSRGQSGQNSLPRPAWGSGGNRAVSPEPGPVSAGAAGTQLGNSAEAPKERVGTTQQDEAILTLEAELEQLRSVCASKDQRIAELSRTDTPAGRLKRDIRNLAGELHNTRRQLKESMGEVQELQAQLSRAEAGVTGREGVHDPANTDSGDSPTSRAAGDSAPAPSGTSASRGSGDRSSGAGADRANLRERISELMEENRQLRETVVQLKGLEGTQHASQPSGVSTQRSSEPSFASSAKGAKDGVHAFSSSAARHSYLSGQPPAGSSAQVAAAPNPQQEETVRQVVYSTANLENAATIGPTMLQGVGTVDGVNSIAKILLQRIHSSVCAVRRPGVAAQQNGPQAVGQLSMIGVGMHATI